MAGSWQGFSEDDIKSINSEKRGISSLKSVNSTPVTKKINKQNLSTRKNVVRERMLQKSKYSGSTVTCDIPIDARLYIPQIPEEEEEEIEIGDKSSVKESATVESVKIADNKSSTAETTMLNYNNQQLSKTEPILSSNVELGALEEFEERQRIIKEQNRLRKEFLRKAIEDRTKKTYEETRRLHQIEGELKKLDDQLVSDVAILRDQIEAASLEFLEAQKRFDLSEQEYLDAKLSLFNKKERKELLTSHLCMIIEHNELRKAKKLSELIEKLDMSSSSSNFLVTRQTNFDKIKENSKTPGEKSIDKSKSLDEVPLSKNEEIQSK